MPARVVVQLSEDRIPGRALEKLKSEIFVSTGQSLIQPFERGIGVAQPGVDSCDLSRRFLAPDRVQFGKVCL